MKVYDPRLDVSPGANPSDERFHVETSNPALIFAALAGVQFDAEAWRRIAEQAAYCEAPIPMDEYATLLLQRWIQTGEHFLHERNDLSAIHPETGIIEWKCRPDPENHKTHTTAYLDGNFSAEQLEALAWWMRNKASKD